MGKDKNDLVGIKFYDKTPEMPADMMKPTCEEDEVEIEWLDRCQRAERKVDKEWLRIMRDKSKYRFSGFGPGIPGSSGRWVYDEKSRKFVREDSIRIEDDNSEGKEKEVCSGSEVQEKEKILPSESSEGA